MTDVNEIFNKTVDALAAADRAQKAMTSKIASQQEELNALRSIKGCSGGFKELVAKMASAGVVDELQAVYLKDNVTDNNVNEFLVKLANVVNPRQTPASPYEMSQIPVTEEPPKPDKYLDECNKRLHKLYNQ